ncbi:FlaA1/EpsC-like NDP-sugar epimerase [Cupriavidus gilardii J11]|uniref:FlaA1/EpsC-like NDP-sugar epimerase n=1 Tax=Cupriavidus gilardii J11 TaxID=936133 RepID=A0A562BMX1_9BURK|nr:nucleoside-diphosphate sugar epimerase/dehydratase [Cupriavidus gilardii]TWG86431.1 FlaA1/EpsC-like NDP-sugar epimerase [Cupriavidus gilardii J11]
MQLHKSAAPLLALPRSAKRLLVVAVDLVLSIVSVWIAYYLRLDQAAFPQLQQHYPYILAPLLAFPIFVRFGMYRAIFRYAGMAVLGALVKAVALYGALFFATLLIAKWDGVPRSIGLIQPIILLLLVGVSRALARLWLNAGTPRARSSGGRFLIYGAGEAGVQTASALSATHQVVLLGFVDDDAAKVGGHINGLDILPSSRVAEAVEKMGVTDILLAMPSVDRLRRNAIIAQLRELPVHVRTVPGMVDLASGRVTVHDFQELDVEDLLGRPPVPPNPALLARNLAGKVVLVTGAGGSIGSELCRQIIMEKPSKLVLVEHNEFGLYSIHRELESLCHEHELQFEIVPLLASCGSIQRMMEIFRLHRPATVYHAAAYKHVPLVECNPAEGVLNNVFGTFNVARAALETGASHFVLISTDKAVRPTNVMGASKRVAELVLQALAAQSRVRFSMWDGANGAEVRHQTVFAIVRFGNVLGSSGSVVPLFRKQLREGGPLTVTHPEVTRYFMTIPEAAQLVLQAGAMAHGGDVFVLDMGSPVRILDLAKRMIQLSGLSVRDEENPDGDIEIAITGLRPGEKLYEELLIGDNPEGTDHERIMKASEDFVPWEQLEPQLFAMRQAAINADEEAIKIILKRLVHGYGPEVVGEPLPAAVA